MMETHSPLRSAYLRFLQLISAVEAMPGLEDFDANERALFDSLCLSWSQEKPMTVREAIHQASLGSPATLHKRLQRLIQKGLIVAEGAEMDRRTKYLRPAQKGLAYVDWLSSQMGKIQSA